MEWLFAGIFFQLIASLLMQHWHFCIDVNEVFASVQHGFFHLECLEAIFLCFYVYPQGDPSLASLYLLLIFSYLVHAYIYILGDSCESVYKTQHRALYTSRETGTFTLQVTVDIYLLCVVDFLKSFNLIAFVLCCSVAWVYMLYRMTHFGV